MKNRPKRTDAMEHADPFDRRTIELLYGRNDDGIRMGDDMAASDHHDIIFEERP